MAVIPKYADEAAFPRPQEEKLLPAQWGLTKREYFSAVALQAVIAKNPPCGGNHDSSDCDKPALYSRLAVHYADALLTELNKRP